MENHPSFFRPPTSNDRSTLILGLPWLYDVDARIKFRKFQIKLGDKSKEEKQRNIQTRQFKPTVYHSLPQIIPDTPRVEESRFPG